MVPDISHLRVFGCGAYVHIPKDRRANALSPKSELMVYLGHIEGIKASTFMRLSNNTLFTSTTALFDETIFSKCETKRVRKTTRLREPKAHQPPLPIEDTAPGDFDDPIPEQPKREVAPESDRTSGAPEKDAPTASQPPPSAPEPVPPHRSVRLRKIPAHSGNVYGESRHPTEIEQDVQQNRTWRKMTEGTPSSSRGNSTS